MFNKIFSRNRILTFVRNEYVIDFLELSVNRKMQELCSINYYHVP